jgi:hypothetical protein
MASNAYPVIARFPVSRDDGEVALVSMREWAQRRDPCKCCTPAGWTPPEPGDVREFTAVRELPSVLAAYDGARFELVEGHLPEPVSMLIYQNRAWAIGGSTLEDLAEAAGQNAKIRVRLKQLGQVWVGVQRHERERWRCVGQPGEPSTYDFVRVSEH